MWKFGSPWLYFSSPVFGPGDRVENGGGSSDPLEAELVGKTPAQIVQIMKDREGRLRAELTPAPPRVPPPPEPPQPTNTEFWNDPNASVDRKIAAKAMTKEEFERVRLSIGPSLIWAAKQMVKEKFKDFHRVEAKVNEIMARIPDWQHTDPNMWETVFIQARGMEHERLAAEDRAAPLITSERVNAGGTPPPLDADLYKVIVPGVSAGSTPKSAGIVADRLGVSHDSYRKSQKILDGEGLLPLTVDNRGSK